MIRKDFIERKLDLIQEELEKLKQLSGYTIDQIAADFLKQNTLERLLEKIIIRRSRFEKSSRLLRNLLAAGGFGCL